MRKKSIRGLLCLLVLVVLGGTGKAKDGSASTEEIVPVEEMEQAETINNTDDTEIIFLIQRNQEKPILQGLQRLWEVVRCAGISMECNTYATSMQQIYQ